MKPACLSCLAAFTAIVVLATAAAPAEAATPGKMSKERYVFGDRTITYYLFVPKSLPAATKAPAIVMLHGSGRDGSLLVDLWKALAEKEGIILVGPDAANPAIWQVPTDGPASLCGLVLELEKTLPIDSKRVYLFGHSGGAVFTLYMSVLESNFFAAGSLHAGAWRAQDDYKAIATAERKIPMAIWVGDSDRLFSVADVTKTADAFKQNGHAVQLEVIRNHDHNYYEISKQVNTAVWAFLKDKQLEGDQVYKPYQVW